MESMVSVVPLVNRVVLALKVLQDKKEKAVSWGFKEERVKPEMMAQRVS